MMPLRNERQQRHRGRIRQPDELPTSWADSDTPSPSKKKKTSNFCRSARATQSSIFSPIHNHPSSSKLSINTKTNAKTNANNLRPNRNRKNGGDANERSFHANFTASKSKSIVEPKSPRFAGDRDGIATAATQTSTPVPGRRDKNRRPPRPRRTAQEIMLAATVVSAATDVVVAKGKPTQNDKDLRNISSLSQPQFRSFLSADKSLTSKKAESCRPFGLQSSTSSTLSIPPLPRQQQQQQQQQQQKQRRRRKQDLLPHQDKKHMTASSKTTVARAGLESHMIGESITKVNAKKALDIVVNGEISNGELKPNDSIAVPPNRSGEEHAKSSSSLCKIYGDECYCENCFDATHLERRTEKSSLTSTVENINDESLVGTTMIKTLAEAMPNSRDDSHLNNHQQEEEKCQHGPEYPKSYRISFPMCNYNNSDGDRFRLLDTCGRSTNHLIRSSRPHNFNVRVPYRTYQRCYCEDCTKWEDIAPDEDDAWNTDKTWFPPSNTSTSVPKQERSTPECDSDEVSDTLWYQNVSLSSSSSSSSSLFMNIREERNRTPEERNTTMVVLKSITIPLTTIGFSPSLSPRYLFLEDSDEGKEACPSFDA